MDGKLAYLGPVRPIRKLSIAEQTAEHVREGIRSGRWRGELPGVLRLAAELDVSKDAVRHALRILEAEGQISPGRAGARRRVLGSPTSAPRRAMRVAILLHDPLAEESRVMCDILRGVQRGLEVAGHAVTFAAKTQAELHHDPARIAKLVAATPADAWVLAPAPRVVQEFFAAQPVPVMAIGKLYPDVPVAGVHVDVTPAYCEVARRLIAFGHRRIVLLCPRSWRQPAPGLIVQAFTAELAAHGIAAGEFNAPDYEPTTEGLHTLLESLFRVTPPTALIVEEPDEATAAYLFLSRHRLAVPDDVSLFIPWRDASLQKCRPPVAHLHCDERLLIRRIVRWVRAVARGRADRETVAVPAVLVPGGSLAPVRTEETGRLVRDGPRI